MVSRVRASLVGRLGMNGSMTESVEVMETSCSTMVRIVSRAVSPVGAAFCPMAIICPCGHRSGSLPGMKSDAVRNPCSRLSMPRVTASWKLTEQRCPVTPIPRRWASSMAAPRAARLMLVYALIQVAPSSAQYATKRRASSGVSMRAILPPLPPPVM